MDRKMSVKFVESLKDNTPIPNKTESEIGDSFCYSEESRLNRKKNFNK